MAVVKADKRQRQRVLGWVVLGKTDAPHYTKNAPHYTKNTRRMWCRRYTNAETIPARSSCFTRSMHTVLHCPPPPPLGPSASGGSTHRPAGGMRTRTPTRTGAAGSRGWGSWSNQVKPKKFSCQTEHRSPVRRSAQHAPVWQD